MPRGGKQLQLQWKSTENLQCAIVQRYVLGSYALSSPKKYIQLKRSDNQNCNRKCTMSKGSVEKVLHLQKTGSPNYN